MRSLVPKLCGLLGQYIFCYGRSSIPSRNSRRNDQRIWVTIDWDKARLGTSEGSVNITGPDGRITKVKLSAFRPCLSSMTMFPVTAKSVMPPDSPRLDYEMYLFHPGEVEVAAIVAPTLNVVPGRGLRYAVSFDDQPPQFIDALPQNTAADWAQAMEDSVRKVKSTHVVEGAGYHNLKFWMVDPGIVPQKLIVNTGRVKPSYLGRPESFD